MLHFLHHVAVKGQLRSAVEHDLKSPIVRDQLVAMGLWDLIFFGPWIKKTYQEKEANLAISGYATTAVASLANFSIAECKAAHLVETVQLLQRASLQE